MRGLIVRQPWIDLILNGQKSWEIRGRATRIRGRIGLIQSGSGRIMGTVNLVDCLALTPDDYYQAEALHQILEPASQPLPYRDIYAWVLACPQRFEVPQPYQHRQGAVIWVRLPK